MIDETKLSDEELVEKSRTSDKEIYALIIQRYQSKLLRYAFSLIRDEYMATDIVQESFIKAYINLEGFDIKKKFSSWIYRIVHNEAINLVKKNQKEVLLPDDIDFKSEEDIEKDFEQKELANEVGKCLDKIPVMYSEPLTLFYIEEKSYEEIGDILRIPMGTVAIRIRRAKILMKHICQKK